MLILLTGVIAWRRNVLQYINPAAAGRISQHFCTLANLPAVDLPSRKTNWPLLKNA